MGLSTIITLVPEKFWPDVFRDEFASIPLMPALAGYIPESLLCQPPPVPFRHRRWHIGYRGRTMAYIYGLLTREKYTIGLEMQEICRRRGIPANIDVTEDGRLYGDAWIAFNRDCRVLLGTESGSNVFDFDGTISSKIQAHLAQFPNASFEEVHELFLSDVDGAIRMNQLSPKIFEAIALGTGLVLFEGEYSGVLTPWRHYIPLKKDYSNIDEVLQAVDDIPFLEQMTHQAMQDIVQTDTYSYRRFIQRIDERLDQLCPLPHSAESITETAVLRATTSKPPVWDTEIRKRSQEENEKACSILAQKLSGQKALFFGAGKAYQYYKHFFQNVEPIGFYVDEVFLTKPTAYIDGIPLLSPAALETMPTPENIVLFSKQEHFFGMKERVWEMFPNGPEPVSCILSGPSAGDSVCDMPPLA